MMALRFYSIGMILAREKIGAQDDDRDTLIDAIANEENQ